MRKQILGQQPVSVLRPLQYLPRTADFHAYINPPILRLDQVHIQIIGERVERSINFLSFASVVACDTFQSAVLMHEEKLLELREFFKLLTKTISEITKD